MNIRSAKAKGRRLCAELKDSILKHFPALQPDDVRVTSSSVPGEDLMLSPAAAAIFPFAIEGKNVEKLNIWEAIKQAREHSAKCGRTPLVVFRRNNEEPHAVVPLEKFLELCAKAAKP